MKRKHLIRAIWILLLLLVLMSGAVVGLMFRETQKLNNQFDLAKVECVVHEKLDDGTTATKDTQYADTKTSIQVENTGNIDAYIRLRFVSYWVNSEGKIVARPSQMPEISIFGDWVAGSDGTYYHRQPVKPGEMTEELLAAKISLEISEEGYYQVLEVFADAIQSRPERAAKDKWGVSIDDGAIVTGK